MKRSLAIWVLLLLAGGRTCPNDEKSIQVSDDIELVKLSDKTYLHVSTVEIPSYGKVSANGLLLIDQGKALLFDSPWTNEQTEILLDWIADSLRVRVTAFVPNHWHEDCMGGLECLHRRGIPSYANRMTVEIAAGKGLPVPRQSFTDSITLNLNDIEADCYYPGAGHAIDNIVVWIPSEQILFAGCMAKDMQSQGLGNLSDASLEEWPGTIDKLIARFPSARTVIPGHGQPGGRELLTHTKNLLLCQSEQ